MLENIEEFVLSAEALGYMFIGLVVTGVVFGLAYLVYRALYYIYNRILEKQRRDARIREYIAMEKAMWVKDPELSQGRYKKNN